MFYRSLESSGDFLLQIEDFIVYSNRPCVGRTSVQHTQNSYAEGMTLDKTKKLQMTIIPGHNSVIQSRIEEISVNCSVFTFVKKSLLPYKLIF